METHAPAFTIQDAIDDIGFGPFQRKLMLVAGLTWAADAAEVLLIAFALPDITREFGLDSLQASLIVTATFLGMLVGAWFWGNISDRIGRRTGFQLTVLIFAVFGAVSALAPNALWLAILRAITGFGLGGALPLDFSLFAEYLPSQRRGRYLVLLESFWALGTIVAAGLAWLLVPTVGWRPLLASTGVAAFLVLWIRAQIPESPRYLATAGRLDEARAVLAKVAEANDRPTPPLEEAVPATRPATTPATLWEPRFRRRTTMLWLAWFGISLGYYGMFTWLPSVFVGRGFTFLDTFQYTFILALAQIPGYFSAAYLVERWGRKPTLASYLAVAGVFTYLFATVSTTAWVVTSAVLMSFFALGAWGALYAYTPELYPTEARATGVGWASGMTRIAGAIAPVVGGLLLPISLVVALTIYAVGFVAAAAAVALLGVETRGEPLLDIGGGAT
ncbi:MAG: MFS transporter [Actinobacteria bacterium]|nr:MFS transporter [Actinomycetota bacterium]